MFLYRFAGYVEWPMRESSRASGAGRGSPPGPSSSSSSSYPREAAASARPFIIDVIGARDVAAELHLLVPGHPIHGRLVRVRVIRRIRQAADAQMLYIGPDYAGNLRAAIAAIASRPILIVTDDEDGLEEGGTINFLEKERRVEFEVSLFAASRSGLKISSDLLSVAARVEGGRLHSDAHCAPGDFYSAVGAGCPQRLASR